MTVLDKFASNYRYYWHNVGIIGKSRTGKSHISTNLMRTAGGRCSVLAPNIDAKVQYGAVSKDIRVAKDNEFNAKLLDNFIDIRKGYKKWCLVLDDVDMFVSSANESRWLGNLPKVNQGHWEQGAIWQARRIKMLPYTLYQNTNYMIFSYGVDERDYDSIVEYTHLDLDLYKQLRPPVKSKIDLNKIVYSEFVILDVETREQAIFSGFD